MVPYSAACCLRAFALMIESDRSSCFRSISAEILADLKTLRGQLLHWLRTHALPLWETHGVDRASGGYFESITFDAERRVFDARGDIRRGRVVARQMFVFHTGRSLGWQCGDLDPLRHGCDYLFAHLKRDDGLFHTAVDARSRIESGVFSLYEAAFYLFAMAKVHGTLSGEYPLHDTAFKFLGLLRQGWGKDNGGFDESHPATLPLKANPHMHLLEAALAWVEATAAMPAEQSAWIALAEEIVDLALHRYIDSRTGALREFFDESWRPMADDSGRIVEPGHQFEWAWLLLQWVASHHCPEEHRTVCRSAASRLVQVGERGVDPHRGVAFNELWDDMTPKDTSAKLWPQTERVKAWCAVLEGCTTPEQAESAGRNLSQSILGLQRYLDFEPMGLWQEAMLADGTFTREPCKASSFYHIVCAIEIFDRCMARAESIWN